MDAESRTKNGDCCKEVAEISELTFAPTAREDTFKLFMALATLMNWDLRQLDVRSAFTNAMLIEKVYMWAPKGVYTPTRVCKLLRPLYGLKQSPRSWNSDFSKKLIENGFERCALDARLFRKYISAEQGWVYLICYVDDIIVGGGTEAVQTTAELLKTCLLYTSPSPRDGLLSRMPSSA